MRRGKARTLERMGTDASTVDYRTALVDALRDFWEPHWHNRGVPQICRYRAFKTRQYLLPWVFLTGLAWTAVGFCSDETSLRTFRLPSGITVSVPNSWVVAEDRDLRQYELTRDRILEEKGVKQGISKAHVPFQARRQLADATSSMMFSLLPPEASQDEVMAWRPAQIAKLGELLGDAQKRALRAAGCGQTEVLPASIRTVGGKAAVAFELRFVCSNGVWYVAEKFYIYAKDKTVILSFQFNESAAEILRNDRIEILRALKIE